MENFQAPLKRPNQGSGRGCDGGVSGPSSVEGGGSLLPVVPHGGGWTVPQAGAMAALRRDKLAEPWGSPQPEGRCNPMSP